SDGFGLRTSANVVAASLRRGVPWRARRHSAVATPEILLLHVREGALGFGRQGLSGSVWRVRNARPVMPPYGAWIAFRAWEVFMCLGMAAITSGFNFNG